MKATHPFFNDFFGEGRRKLAYIVSYIMESSSCELLHLKILTCFIGNHREGAWERYDCKGLIDTYNETCQNNEKKKAVPSASD